MPNDAWEYGKARIQHWKKMAAAFEKLAERRLGQLAEVEGALVRANKRIAELSGEEVVRIDRRTASDPIGELMSARLLIQNLRRQLRERSAAQKAA